MSTISAAGFGSTGLVHRVLNARRTRHAEYTERSALGVGTQVWVTSRRGWVTEAVISAVTSDRRGTRHYECEYPALPVTAGGLSLRERIIERVVVSPGQLVAWRS
jgi:hypothetical protein